MLFIPSCKNTRRHSNDATRIVPLFLLVHCLLLPSCYQILIYVQVQHRSVRCVSEKLDPYGSYVDTDHGSSLLYKKCYRGHGGSYSCARMHHHPERNHHFLSSDIPLDTFFCEGKLTKFASAKPEHYVIRGTGHVETVYAMYAWIKVIVDHKRRCYSLNKNNLIYIFQVRDVPNQPTDQIVPTINDRSLRSFVQNVRPPPPW
jgi:hypothetical protein